MLGPSWPKKEKKSERLPNFFFSQSLRRLSNCTTIGNLFLQKCFMLCAVLVKKERPRSKKSKTSDALCESGLHKQNAHGMYYEFPVFSNFPYFRFFFNLLFFVGNGFPRKPLFKSTHSSSFERSGSPQSC